MGKQHQTVRYEADVQKIGDRWPSVIIGAPYDLMETLMTWHECRSLLLASRRATPRTAPVRVRRTDCAEALWSLIENEYGMRTRMLRLFQGEDGREPHIFTPRLQRVGGKVPAVLQEPEASLPWTLRTWVEATALEIAAERATPENVPVRTTRADCTAALRRLLIENPDDIQGTMTAIFLGQTQE